jgi:hypothetical protein
MPECLVNESPPQAELGFLGRKVAFEEFQPLDQRDAFWFFENVHERPSHRVNDIITHARPP